MKIKIFSFVVVTMAFCYSIAWAQNPGEFITFKGYKNIEIGMNIKNIAKTTGFKFSYDSPPENNECTYAYTQSLPGLYLMLTNEIVTRIDVDKGDYTTLKGAKLGDSEETIKKLYPGVEIEGQKYVPEGHYLIVRSPDKKRAIIFDTDGIKVTSFRVGRMPEVEYVEGCN